MSNDEDDIAGSQSFEKVALTVLVNPSEARPEVSTLVGGVGGTFLTTAHHVYPPRLV